MTATTRDPVLRRKIVRRAPDPQAAAPAVSGPAREIVRGFARAVSEHAQLVAEGGARVHGRFSLAELLDSIDPDAFVGLLSPGSGVAVIDQSGFSALIEAMTIGRLASRAPVSRRATPTDAALLAEVVNAMLAAQPGGDPAQPQTLRRPVPDHRLLPVLLEDGVYDRVSLDVTLVSGTVRRPARVTVALPVSAGQESSVPTGAAATPAPVDDWAHRLEASVMTAPASLRAELGRLTLPLSEVLTLGEGSALTLPLSALEEIRMVALDGTVHAVGRLGQARGMRAVRLTSWPNGAPGPAAAGYQDRDDLRREAAPVSLGAPKPGTGPPG